MTPEEMQAKIEALEAEKVKILENQERLKDQLKGRPPVAEVLAFLKGEKDAPTDDRIPPSLIDTILGLRTTASESEKKAAALAKKAAEQEKAAMEAAEKFAKLQERVDFGTLKSQLAKVGGEKLNPDMVDLLAETIKPYVAKDEKGDFFPAKDGKPWIHDGKTIAFGDLLEDMSPSGKGAFLPKRTGFFRPDAGSYPGDAGGGGGGKNTNTGTGLRAQAAELAKRAPGSVPAI